MKRVYLDQAEWVEFSRASLGRPADQRVADALEIARYGVRQGLLTFPLPSSHYMETMGTKRWRQREPLAAVMAELSQFQTIADQRRILDMELDLALRRRFGRPYEVRAVAVFGRGVAHAFGEPTLDEVQSPDLRDLLDRQPALALKFREARELAMLAGPPEDLPVPWLRTDAHRAAAKRFSGGQQDLVDRSGPILTHQTSPRSNLFQRNTTGASLNSAMPWWMRAFSSSIESTRM